MILILAQVECHSCGGENWTRMPSDLLATAIQCRDCSDFAAFPKANVPFHILSPDSEAVYDWYSDQPELIVLDPPERLPGVPCRP